MMLVRLIYASTKTEHWNDYELKQLIDQSTERNRKECITGVLIFNRKYFLQCIEGKRSKVSELYARILHDKRHKNVQLLTLEEIDEREMERWSMCYVPDSQITQEMVLKYSDTTDFDPYDMTAKGALAFLRRSCELLN
ncbi:BLUF domain-containing protein [Thalassolituus sp. LLYu03]|uniref:BLUF domain-containing protein n=1 Tax=Thalassolituus sp. LLYu03 TaxID=3421656 RepID=UPI003D267A1E